MPYAAAQGARLYYEVQGQGDPLVVVNGLGADMSEPESLSLTKVLAERYKVLAFDNRGAGRSDKPREPYSIEQMADDTSTVMESAGFKQSAILGISMGGRIALALTLQHPEKVEKLVLVSTAARVIPTWQRRLLFAIVPYLPTPKGKYPQPAYAFVRQRTASSAYDCVDRLDQIHVPTLIMHGKNDHITPYPLAEETHQGIKGSKLEAFEGGHLFFMFRQRPNFLKNAITFISGSE